MPPCPHKYCVALPNQRKMMQGEERHYYCMYVWEDVWPLSLASSPAPHVTHQLGPNVDQDRKTIQMKQNVNKRKQVLMLLGCCFPLFVIFLCRFHDHANIHWILNVGTPEAILAPYLCNDTYFSLQFTPPCWHLWAQAICDEFTQLCMKASKFTVYLFISF